MATADAFPYIMRYMSHSSVPKLAKWPFVLANVALIGLAGIVVIRDSAALGIWQALLPLTAVGVGGWLCALPFLREYEAKVRLLQGDQLAKATAQFGDLEGIKTQIGNATAQWQGFQQQSSETVATAKELTNRLRLEMNEFCSFLQKASDSEKNHLRLEVEKLRRGEKDWLQAIVFILDHVFALHAAAGRSGQPTLVAQLNQFQHACRDAARRLGLTGFAPAIHDRFDEKVHQLEDGNAMPNGALRVSEILALGYTFRGELVRKVLVRAAALEQEGTEAGEISSGLGCA